PTSNVQRQRHNTIPTLDFGPWTALGFFDPEADCPSRHHVEGVDLCQRPADGPLHRLVGHHHDRATGPGMPALLDHRGDGDVVTAQDPRDLRENPRLVDSHQPEVIASPDLIHWSYL